MKNLLTNGTISVCELFQFVSHFILSSLMVSHFNCFSQIKLSKTIQQRFDWSVLASLKRVQQHAHATLVLLETKVCLENFYERVANSLSSHHKTNRKLKAFFHEKEDDSNTFNTDTFETLQIRKSKWTPQRANSHLQISSSKNVSMI